MELDVISVNGAREHNLKNVDVNIPRKTLTVITGVSGSGKSSLAFDTLFVEGQRRYIESFNSYARNFLGTNIKRPDVDDIVGLGPVISIEQKTTNKNPRSTVGTVTEIYDFIRLLYARVGAAYSYINGNRMQKYGDDTIVEMILKEYKNRGIYILSPIVRHRKGHYKELFEKLRKKGYLNVRVDGVLKEIVYNMQLVRYKTHTIEVVIDKIKVNNSVEARLRTSLKQAMREGDNVVMVMDMDTNEVKYYSRNLMDPLSGISYSDPAPNNFSFNSPVGQCPYCGGLGVISVFDEGKIFVNRNISIKDGAISVLPKKKLSANSKLSEEIDNICIKYGFSIKDKLSELPEELIKELLYGDVESLNDANLNVFSSIKNLIDLSIDYSEDRGEIEELKSYFKEAVCSECNGSRLNKEALSYLVNGKNIGDVSKMEITSLYDWVLDLEKNISEDKKVIATEILKEIKTRVKFLINVGLGYLSLNRGASTLSGGESQRIRLATQIGTQLVEVLYILDEPSIGLHQQDNMKLIETLKSLRDLGNTVIVVEHDRDMITNSDYIVDVGPKAGKKGGEIVYQGNLKEMMTKDTTTAKYISGERQIKVPSDRRKGNGLFLDILGANGNNLKNIDVSFPLGKLIGIAGVSGSGKSSLINRTLYPAISKIFYRSIDEPLPYSEIVGLENIDKIISVDQQPIGRTPRSNPATYTGVFTLIRNLFASLPESKMRGYNSGRFSFNVKSGRCEVCDGNGYKKIEMNFLPDVYILCDSCCGKRYNRDTLEIRYRGKSISDVLSMTINEAVEFFQNIPAILSKIEVLKEVGLGYITLGQSSTTLSGGESQRIKLASELSRRDTGRTLYILDEPTTGLHFEDIDVLIKIFNKLVDKGNTIIVIEHNMDILKVCDHIIEIGPDGGDKGGQLIFEGTPEEMIGCQTPTSQFMNKELSMDKK